MSSALNLEMREVEKAIVAANAAVTREQWTEAERALAEVQDRVAPAARGGAEAKLSSDCRAAQPYARAGFTYRGARQDARILPR
jgi:hypothetical protein